MKSFEVLTFQKHDTKKVNCYLSEAEKAPKDA